MKTLGFSTVIFALLAHWGAGAAAAEPELLALHTSRVTGIAFSNDGKWFGSVSSGKIIILNWKTKKEAMAFDRTKGDSSPAAVHSLAFSPDSKSLAVGYTAWTKVKGVSVPVGAIQVWDVATGREGTLTADEALTNPMSAVAYSPDGLFLAGGAKRSPSKEATRIAKDMLPAGVPEGEFKLWNREKISLKAEVPAPFGPVTAIAFQADSKVVAFGCGDTSYTKESADRVGLFGQFVLWDIKGSKEIVRVDWNSAAVCAVSFNSAGILAVGGGRPSINTPEVRRPPLGRLILWDPAAKKTLVELRGHRFVVSTLAFSPDGTLLLAGGGDYGLDKGELRLWDVKKEREITNLSASFQSIVGSVVFAPDGKSFAVASGNDITIWNLADVVK